MLGVKTAAYYGQKTAANKVFSISIFASLNLIFKSSIENTIFMNKIFLKIYNEIIKRINLKNLQCRLFYLGLILNSEMIKFDHHFFHLKSV